MNFSKYVFLKTLKMPSIFTDLTLWLVLANVLIPVTVYACDDGFIHLKSQCVKVTDASVNYETAKYICEKVHGGSMYEAKSEKDQEMLGGIAIYGYGIGNDLWVSKPEETTTCTALSRSSLKAEPQPCEKKNAFICQKSSKVKSSFSPLDQNAYDKLELRISELENSVQKLEVEVAVTKVAAAKCEKSRDFEIAESLTGQSSSNHTVVPSGIKCASPPVVLPLPKNRSVLATLDKDVELSCTAYGYPLPEIRWTVPLGVRYGEANVTRRSTSITSKIVQREAKPNHSGKYSCAADNSVGPVVDTSFFVQVLHAAKTGVISNVVQTGTLQEVSLQCIVQGLPKPTVVWKKLGAVFGNNATENVLNQTSFISTVTFVILDASKDLGVYSCHAKNSLGESMSEIHVKGAPPFDVAVTDVTEIEQGKFSLSLAAKSYCAIKEYKILFKSKNDPLYTFATVGPKYQLEAGVTHYSETFELPTIGMGQIIEVLLEAKNEFGSNSSSTAFEFNSTYVCGQQAIAEKNWRFLISNEFYGKINIFSKPSCETNIGSENGLEIEFVKFSGGSNTYHHSRHYHVQQGYCVQITSVDRTETVCDQQQLRLEGSSFVLREKNDPTGSDGFIARFRQL